MFHMSELFVIYYATSLVGSGATCPNETHYYFCNKNYEYSLSKIHKDSKKLHVGSGQVLPPNEFAANFPKTFSFQNVLESGTAFKGLWTFTIPYLPYEYQLSLKRTRKLYILKWKGKAYVK